MKILFLDIDGVLNCDTTSERIKGRGILTGFMGIDQRILKIYLDWLKERPELAVVLSSSWRGYEGALEELKDNGIYWVGVTPKLGSRSDEIAECLKHMRQSNIDIDAYAILDDLDLFSEEQLPYFVQTDHRYGVTIKDLKKIDKILELNT